MPRSQLLAVILRIPGFLLGVSIHEYAHARTAYALGDDTAERTGRLTLEPWAHIDPWGALMLIFLGFGWARPVPVNSFLFKNPRKDMAKVAVAGPLANLVGALLLEIFTILTFSWLHLRGTFWAYLPQILDTAAWVNASLAFFNLVPVPPLDGWHVMQILIPRDSGGVLDFLESYGYVVLLVLVLSGIVGRVIGPLVSWYVDLCRLAGLQISLLLKPLPF